MIRVCRVTLPLFLIALMPSLIRAQDLSMYRGFRFGMKLDSVARKAGMNPVEAKTLHKRPALIQELWWQRSPRNSFPEPDAVREIVFSFYDGALFRIVVNYDRNSTEGLTDEEMIQTISAKYGVALRPVSTAVLFSTAHIYNDNEKVLALWENSKYAYSLYRSSNQSAFGMLILSKRLDTLAQTAIAMAMKLDKAETPP
jgi:hypothetical protein